MSGLFYAVLIPILVNLPIICGYLKTDPILLYSGLGVDLHRGPLSGLPLIDPSMGFTHENGARLAVEQLLHGRLPWWNYFEGTGVPLAGEMQSSAFFFLDPLVFAFNGQALINVVVELMSSVGLYLLLRRLQFAELGAAVAGILYGLNGSYAWLGAEQFYPAAFLPFLLYGYERIYHPMSASSRGRWGWIAVPTTLSLTTGFPETAYIDALLGVAWGAARLATVPASRRTRAAANAVLGSILGVFLAAPLLISFFDYLRVSFVGGHAGAFGSVFFPTTALIQTFLPYAWGPIFRFAMPDSVWGSIGGYLGISGVLLASIAIQGRRLRHVRILCLAWAVVVMGASFGVPVLHAIVVHVPGIRYTAFFRYAPATWELCISILVGFCLDDLELRAARRRGVTIAWVAAFVLVLVYYSKGRGDVFAGLLRAPGYSNWLTFTIVFAVSTFVLVVFGLFALRGRGQAVVLGAVAIVEATTFLMIPMFANLTGGSLDLRGVGFLRSHLGFARIYSTAPIAPNYGSYFGLSQINYNDAPISILLYGLAHDLDPYVDPTLFTGTILSAPGTPTRVQTFRDRLRLFEAAGVRYLVTPTFGGEDTTTIGEPSGPSTIVNIARSTAPVVATITDRSLIGRIRSIGVLQGNYRGSANGTLHLTACNATGCARGSRKLESSVDNSVFTIPLDPGLSANGSPIVITFSDNGSVPDGFYEFADVDGTSMRLSQAKVELPGRHLELEVEMHRQLYENATVPSGNLPYVLQPSEPVTIAVQDIVPTGRVRAVAILIGNYADTANGILAVTVCSRGVCQHGRRPLRGSVDNAMFRIPLDRPLRVVDGHISLSFVTFHATRPVAIWLYPSLPFALQQIRGSSQVPVNSSARFRLEYLSGNELSRVYSDSLMSIYRAADTTPYVEADGCTVKAVTRDSMSTVCSRPSTLIRLETYMPGWRASVNGRDVDVMLSRPVFQRVAIPAGSSNVRFAFEPPYERVAFALMGIAIILLSGDMLLIIQRRRVTT